MRFRTFFALALALLAASACVIEPGAAAEAITAKATNAAPGAVEPGCTIITIYRYSQADG